MEKHPGNYLALSCVESQDQSPIRCQNNDVGMMKTNILFKLMGGLMGWATLTASAALAQISPDGSTPTSVGTCDTHCSITGGTSLGDRIFHSFQDFNINSDQTVEFIRPDHLAVETFLTILNRVTGQNPSNLLGTLTVEGNANVFLINPNGIVLGPDARLDMSGSFVATTAERILFENNQQFSATDPQDPALLTISTPIGLQYGANPGTVTVQLNQNGMTLPDGAFILAGGEVSLQNAQIRSPGSQIQITGLNSPGVLFLDASVTDAGLTDIQLDLDEITGNEAVQLAPVSIQDSIIEVSTITDDDDALSLTTEFPGFVDIAASQIVVENSTVANAVFSDSLVSQDRGLLLLNASDSIQLDQAILNVENRSTGRAGSIVLGAGTSIAIVNGSELISNGFAGEIIIGAGTELESTDPFTIGVPQQIRLQDSRLSSKITVNPTGEVTGNPAGAIALQSTDNITIRNSDIQLPNETAANGGVIDITGRQIVINGGSIIDTTAVQNGEAGNIQIVAGDRLRIVNNSRIASNGQNGQIDLEAGDRLRIIGGTVVSSDGQDGRIQMFAPNAILIDGKGTLISASLTGESDVNQPLAGGRIRIGLDPVSPSSASATSTSTSTSIEPNRTALVTIQNGATLVTTANLGEVAGNIRIEAGDRLIVDNGSIRTNSNTAASDDSEAGRIRLISGDTLSIRNNSRISSDGREGLIRIFAPNIIQIIEGATISANLTPDTPPDTAMPPGTATPAVSEQNRNLIATTEAASPADPSEGGNLLIGFYPQNIDPNDYTDQIIIRNARLSANTSTSGSGGDIQLRGDRQIMLTQEGVIGAETRGDGNAGEIDIQVPRLFLDDGIITATTTGRGNAGAITLNIPDSIELRNNARIEASAGRPRNSEETVLGTVGEIAISTDRLSLQGQSSIAVDDNAQESGISNSGDINLRLEARQILVTDRSTIRAETNTRTGGNIDLNRNGVNALEIVFLDDNALISSRALDRNNEESSGDAGDIAITANFIVAPPQANSNILTTSAVGQGGNMTLTTTRILGFEQNDSSTAITGNSSTISAEILNNRLNEFSAAGRNSLSSGDLEVNQTGTENPVQSTVVLPSTVLDASALVNNQCTIGTEASQFVNQGRGGLVPDPAGLLDRHLTLVDLGEAFIAPLDSAIATPTHSTVPPHSVAPHQSRSTPTVPTQDQPPSTPIDLAQTDRTQTAPLQEAQRWEVASNGQITLVNAEWGDEIENPEEEAGQEEKALDILVHQGRDAYANGNYEQAIALWEAAVQQAIQHQDSLLYASLLSNIALAYQLSGDDQRAWEVFGMAWEVGGADEANGRGESDEGDGARESEEVEAERAIANIQHPTSNIQQSQGRVLLIAQLLTTQGQLHFVRGHADRAYQTWQQAETWYAQGHYIPGILQTQINQAQALQILGYHARALEVLEQSQDHWATSEDDNIQLIGFQSFGNVLRQVGEVDQSQQVLAHALDLAQTAQSTSNVATLHMSLGHTARIQGDSRQALAHYQQSIALSTHPIDRLQTQLNQFSQLVTDQRLVPAHQMAPDLWMQVQQLPSSRASLRAQLNLAHSVIELYAQSNVNPSSLSSSGLSSSGVDSGMGQANDTPLSWSQVTKRLVEIHQSAMDLGDRISASYALGYLGMIYEDQAQWQMAHRVTEDALVLAETLQSPDLTYRWQWQLGRILKQQGKYNQALAAYDGAYTTLQGVRANLASVNTDVQFSFRDRVEPLYREFVELLLSPQAISPQAISSQAPSPHVSDPQAPFSQYSKRLQQPSVNVPSPIALERALQVIESLQVAEIDDFFHDACSPLRSSQVDQIDAQAAAIYPIILPQRLDVIVSIPGQPLLHHTMATSDAEVKRLLDSLAQSLFKEATATGRLTDDYVGPAQTLYDWLIHPVADQLTHHDINTLVFVLDGPLRNIPMAVLHDGDRHLIESFGIALAPSLSLVDPHPLHQSELKALTAGLTQAVQSFPSLPNVAQELETIQQHLSTEVLLDETFTKAELEDAIAGGDRPILHLATHGQFSSNAEDTFILTWDERISAADFTRLLQEQHLDLLVLSACQTATGDNRAALGLAGVAARAGAQSTLATLWFVDDKATATLMQQFYANLVNPAGVSRAEALRQAQLAVLAQPEFEHPLFWASYVLVGNWL
ncbi:MAG: CHAT domain-containing protein [Merismopedia sp. SIO2A8]|nr:CHAT domain-containing protein [Merismopedia sp. SIO2A8]